MDVALPPAPVLALLDGGSTFPLCLTGAPARRAVEAFIGRCFAAMQGARIKRFMPTPLAPADPRRIEPDGNDWGTCYGASPRVMAIEVPGAFDALAARGAFGTGAFSRNYGFGGTGVAA